jgi:hypothetical protein
MYWIDNAFTLMIVIATLWFIGLALCIGVPLLVRHIFHINVSPWVVGIVSALIWIVGTYIWYIIPT